MTRLHGRLFVCVILCVSMPCWALDAHKTAAALAARAAKAFEAGNMTQAAALYRDAYHIDGSEAAYLYGAARAAHTGHDLVHAEQDYVAYVARADADPARAQKAKTFLVTLRAELSTQKATEAQQAAAGGDALLAASLYLEAWRMAPEQPEPLLKAALLERKLANKNAAIDHLRQYLKLASSAAPGRGTADAVLQELTRAPAPEKPAEPAVQEKPPAPIAKLPEPPVAPRETKPAPVVAANPPPPVVASKPSTNHAPRSVAGWTAIGVGAGAVISAGILAIVANSQQATLDSHLLSDGRFDGHRISVATAASEQVSINGKWTAVAITSGLGAAALGVGAWLVATARADVAVLPNLNGFAIAGSF